MLFFSLNKAFYTKFGIPGRIFNISIYIYVLFFFVAFLKAENEGGNLIECSNSSSIKISAPKIAIEQYNFADQFLFLEEGKSSWYGRKFQNRKTASGERYDMYAYSAAHKTLPFGTIVRVVSPVNNKAVLVKINDRGPFVKDRILDLSKTSANELDISGAEDIKIEGMMFHDNSLIKYTDEDYFFGYSLDLPLTCLPNSVVKLLTSTDNFDEAVEKYKETVINNPGKLVYLMLPVNNIKKYYESLETGIYFIGFFEPSGDGKAESVAGYTDY